MRKNSLVSPELLDVYAAFVFVIASLFSMASSIITYTNKRQTPSGIADTVPGELIDEIR